MALPICPLCGLRDVPRVDAGAIIKRAPPESGLRFTVTRLRTYRCPCGARWRTREVIDAINPEAMWVRKWAEDESIPPTGKTP